MKHMRMLTALPLTVAALALCTAASTGWASDEDEELPFGEADIFFELNDTDGDLGIHARIDGDAWKKLEIEDPRERKMLDVVVSGRLRRQGLTEIFFESAEPPFAELSPEEFFRRFPEGEYEIEGRTLEGDELESTDELSHVLAAPPGNVRISGVDAAENCDVDPLPSISGDEPVVISWAPVTGSHPEIGESGPVEVVLYQLVVEQGDLVLSVDLPPSLTEFEVPAAFVALSDEIKFEIIVREETGNQTAVESCFEIE